MRPSVFVLALAACGAPNLEARPGAFEQQPPPGAGGLTLTAPATLVSGDTLTVEVTAPDLPAGAVVDIGYGTRLGAGFCPFRAQTGGSPCLDVAGTVRQLGQATAVDDGGTVRATLSTTLTHHLPAVYVQAFFLNGVASSTSNVATVALTQPWAALDPRVSATEGELTTLDAAISALQAQDATHSAAIGVLSDDLTAVEADLAALQGQSATLTTDLTAVGATVTDLQADLGDLQAASAGWMGIRDGSASKPAVSCLRLHEDLPDLGNGVYWIDPDGAAGAPAFEAFCDMTSDGGGWMGLFSPTTLATNTVPGVTSTWALVSGNANCAGNPSFTNSAAGTYVATGYGCSTGTYRWNIKWTNPTGARDVRLVAAVQGQTTRTLSVNGRAVSPTATYTGPNFVCVYWNAAGVAGSPGTNACYNNVLPQPGLVVPGVLGGADLTIEVTAGPAAVPDSLWGTGFNVSQLFVR